MCSAAVVKSASTVNQANRVFRIYDRFALERSLARLVSGYEEQQAANPVAADEERRLRPAAQQS